MDPDLLRYDQDSEDEWDDLNGENLSDGLGSENDGSQCQSLIDEGFIVSDDSVLSDTSFCDEDEDASRIRLNKLLKRENIKRLREKRKALVE